MKQKDITLIIVVVAISGALSFVVAQYFLKPQTKQIKAEYVQPITTDFTPPNSKYFNQYSINPTQQIQIGDGTNTAPYNGTSR